MRKKYKNFLILLVLLLLVACEPPVANKAIAKPANVSASDGDASITNGIKITWSAVVNADQYYVHYCTKVDGVYKIFGDPVVGTEYHYYNEDLNAKSTPYYFKVTSYAASFGHSVFSNYDVGYIYLSAPYSFSASDGLYENKVVLTWDAVASSSIQKYYIYRKYRYSSSSIYSLIDSTSEKTYSDLYDVSKSGSIVMGSEYYYQVSAKAYTETEKSSADVGYCMLSYVQDIKASQGTYTDKVKVEWTLMIGGVTYYVYRNSTPKETEENKFKLLDSMSLEQVAASPYYYDAIKSGYTSIAVKYYYQVLAKLQSGKISEYSPDTALGYISLPRVRNVAANDNYYIDSIKVRWDAVEGANSYNIYRSISEVTSTNLATYVGNTKDLNYIDYSMIPGMNYYYYVTALKDKFGESLLSNGSFTYAKIAPAIIDTFVAEEGKVRLMWNCIKGAQQYHILRFNNLSTANEAKYYEDYKSNNSIKIATISAVDDKGIFRDSTMLAGKIYYYKVVSQGKDYYSDLALSNVKAAYSLLNRPKNLQVSKATYEDSISLTWNSQLATDSVENYKILRSDFFPYEEFDTIATLNVITSYIDKNIYNGRVYCYKVVAYNSLAGNSFASDKDSGYSRIKAPKNFTVSKGVYGGDNPKIKLTWNIDSAATGYKIYKGSFLYKEISSSKVSEYYDEGSNNVIPGTLYLYYIISIPPYSYTTSYIHNTSDVDTGYAKLDSCTINVSKGSYSDRIVISISILDKHRNACEAFYVEKKIDTSGSSWQVYNSSLALATISFEDRSVVAGYKYYYRIKNYKQYYNYEKESSKQNYSEYSNIDSGSVRLSPPSYFVASKGEKNEYITLNWNKASLATEYSIERKRDDKSNSEYKEIFQKKDNDISVNSTNGYFEYKDSDIIGGYAYYYRIRSLNSNFGIDNLASDSAVDYGYKKLPVPILYETVYENSIIDSIAGVSWEDLAYASLYTIHRMEDTINKTNYLKVDLGKVSSYGDTSLYSGKKYYFALTLKRISATNSNDTLSISDTSNYIEIFKHIKAPINFSVSDGDTINRSLLTFTWNVADKEDPSGFLIYESEVTKSTLISTITSSSAKNTTIEDNVDANRGKPRYFAIKTYNSTTKDTSSFSIRDMGYIPLSTPSLNSISEKADTGKVKITWINITNSSIYALYRAKGTLPNASDFVYIKDITQADPYDYYSSKTDALTLIPGQYYTYKIKAISDYVSQGIDSSSFSNSKSGVSLLLPPYITASIGLYDSIVVSWNSIFGATGYEISRQFSYETSFSILDTAATIYYVDTNCANSVSAIYKVKSYREGYVLSGYSNEATGMSRMGQPTEVAVSKSAYKDSIRIRFTETNNANKYQIYRSLGNKNSFEYLTELNGNNIDLEIQAKDSIEYFDKISNSDYKGMRIFYKVRSYNSTYGYSNFTSINNWGYTKIPTPQNIIANPNYNYVQITWDKVVAASNYYIYKDSVENTSTSCLVDSVGDVRSYYDTSGLYGKKYYFWVRSRNIDNFVSTNGAMEKSDFPVSGVSGYKKLPVVEISYVSKGVYSEKILIKWQLNSKAYIDSYCVYVNEDNSLPNTGWEKIASLAGNVNGNAIDTFDYKYSFSTIKPLKGKKYYFMVKSIALDVKDTASSSIANVTNITGYIPITPPENFSATKGEGFDTIILKWNKVQAAEKYFIYRTDNITYANNNDLEGFDKHMSVDDTFYYDNSNVERGKKYYYAVKSYNDELGASLDYSNIDTGYVKIKPPTNLVASILQYNDTILLSWEKASGAKNYTLQINYVKNNSTKDTVSLANAVSLGDTSLYIHNASGFNWIDTLGFIYRLKSISKSDISSEYSEYSNLGYPKITIPFLKTIKDNQIDSIKLELTNYSKYSSSLNSMKFEIYRSLDKINYTKIATDDFQGNYTFAPYYYDTTSSLLRGIHYYYKVKKIEQDIIFSDFSNVDSSYIKMYNPISVSASKGTQKNIIITWSKVVYAQKYYIYRLGTLPSDISEFTPILDSATYSGEDYQKYSDSLNLVVGKNYYYTVRASNVVAGVSYDKYKVFDSGYTSISHPINIRTINNQSDKIDLVFDQIPKAKCYLIKRSTSKYTGYSDSVVVANPSEIKDSIVFEDNGTNTTLGSSLIKGKIYWYKVATLSETGNISDYSGSVYGYLKLPTPTIFEGTRDSLKKVVLTWNKVGKDIGTIIYYNVYRKKYNENSYVKAHTEELTDSVITDLNVAPYGRKISYKLVAYVNDEVTRYSEETVLDTAKAKLLLPNNFAVSKGSQINKVIISWDRATNNGATKYILRRKVVYPIPAIPYDKGNDYLLEKQDFTYEDIQSGQDVNTINYDNIYEYSIQARTFDNSETLEDSTEFSAVDTGYIMLKSIEIDIPEIKTGKNLLELSPKAYFDTNFYVYRSENINFTNEEKYITKDTAYYDSIGIVGGVKYYYRARLKDEKYGFSNYSRIDSAWAKLKAPLNLTASRNKYAKVVLEWEEVPNAGSYRIYRGDNINFAIDTVFSGTTYTDSTMVNLGVDLKYRVRAYLVNAGESDTSKFALGYAKVPLVDSLTATIWKSPSKISLGWKEINNASGYLVYRSEKLSGEYTKIYNVGKVSSYDDNNSLERGKVYYYKLKSYANNDTSSLSEIYAKGCLYLNFPTMVSASKKYTDRIEVIYNKRDNAQFYKIYRDTLTDLSTKILVNTVSEGENDTVYVDQYNLKLGKLYYYVVKAGVTIDNVIYESDSSSSSKSGALRPEHPKNISASFGLYNDSIVVTWEKLSYAEKYDVHLVDTAGSIETYKESKIDITNNKAVFDTTDKKLTKIGYPYKFIVVANMGNLDYMLSDSLGFAYGATKLAIPKFDSITKGRSKEISLYWKDINYETTYYIFKADSLKGIYNRIKEIGTDISLYSVEGIGYGIKYYYKMMAYNFNTRIYSDTSIIDSGYSRLLTPDKPSVTPEFGEITISWTKVANATKYEIISGEFDTLDNFVGNASIGETTNTSFEDTTVKMAYSYKYRVIAKNEIITSGDIKGTESDTSDYSDSATPLIPPIENILVSQGTYTDSIGISWKHVPGAIGYYICADTMDIYDTLKSNSPALIISLSSSGNNNEYNVSSNNGSNGFAPNLVSVEDGRIKVYWVKNETFPPEPAKKYYFNINFAIAGNEYSKFDITQTKTGYLGLETPKIKSVSSNKLDTIEVHLSNVKASNYNIIAFPKTLGLDIIYESSSDTTFYLIANNMEGEPYTIRAYASIPLMSIVSDTTTPTLNDTGYSKLTPPINLTAEGGDSTITLNWTFNKSLHGNPNLKGVEEVYIYRKLYSESSFSDPIDTLKNVVDKCTYTDSLDLSNEKIYVYMLKSYRSDYKEADHLSEESMYDTANVKIKKPEIVLASKNYNDSIILKWEYKNDFAGLSTNDYSFEVVYSMTGNTYEEIENLTIQDEGINLKIKYIPNLKGVKYWFKVKLLTTKYGESSYSKDSIAWAKIPAPYNIEAQNGENKITLNFSFDVKSWIDSFYIIRSETNQFLFANTKDTCIEKISGAQKMIYVDSNLTTGKYYYYKVRAKGNIIGLSDTSATYDSAYIYLSAPSTVTANQGEDTLFIKISWGQVEDAKEYYLYKLDETSNTYLSIDTLTENIFSYNDSSAKYGEVCKYKVKAVNQLTSDFSSSIGTGYLKLPRVKEVLADKAQSDRNIKISWNKLKQKGGLPLSEVVYKVLKKDYNSNENTFNNNFYSVVKISTSDSFCLDDYHATNTKYSQYYKYYVIARHTNCEYSSSDTITYLNDYQETKNKGILSLPIPSEFKMSYTYADSIVFAWESNYSGSAKFRIVIDSSGTKDSIIGIDASKNSYTWKNDGAIQKFSLVPGKIYYAQIYLYDSENETYSAKSNKAVGFVRPKKIGSISTNVSNNNQNAKNDSIIINWDKLQGSSDALDTVYQLWVADEESKDNLGFYTKKGELSNKNDTTLIINSQTFNYIRGEKIYFRITASFSNFYDTLIKVYGEEFSASYTRDEFINLTKSDFSDSSYGFTRLAKPKIETIKTNWNSIEIYWTAINAAKEYELIRDTNNAIERSKTEIKVAYYKDSINLSLGKEYNYRVIAQNDYSFSDTSDSYTNNISLELLPPSQIVVDRYYNSMIRLKAGNILVPDTSNVHLLFSSDGSTYSSISSFANGTELLDNVMTWNIDTSATTSPIITNAYPYYFKAYVDYNSKKSDTTEATKVFVIFNKPANAPTQEAYYTEKIPIKINSGQTFPSPSKYKIVFWADGDEENGDTLITSEAFYNYDLNRKISLIYGKKYYAKYAISSDTCMVRESSGQDVYYYSEFSGNNNEEFYLKYPYVTMINTTSYSDSIIFTWNFAYNYIDSSKVKLVVAMFGSESEAGNYSNLISSPPNEYSIDSLKAKLSYSSSFKKGKKYYFRTYVKNTNIGKTETYSDTTDAVSAYFKLEAPTNLSASDGDSVNKVLLKWTKKDDNSSSSEIRAYISYNNIDFELYKTGISYDATNYVDTLKDDINFGRKLYYKIAYYSEVANLSEYSNVDSGYCKLKSPSLSATKGSYKDSLIINWDIVQNANNYILKRYDNNNSSAIIIQNSVLNNRKDSVKANENAIYRGIYYYYFVNSENNLNDAKSPSSDTIMGYSRLDSVRNLQQDSCYTKRIDLKFDPIDDKYSNTKTKYRIYRNLVEDFDTTGRCIGDTATNTIFSITYKDSSTTHPLENGKVYYYRIYASREVASDVYAYCSAYTGMPAPENLDLDTIHNSDVIKIKWDKAKDLGDNPSINYAIYRSENADQIDSVIDYTYSVEDTTYIDYNVERAKVYYYGVRGINNIAVGNLSKILETWLSPRKPDIVSIYKGEEDTIIKIQWKRSENAEYTILYKDKSTSSYSNLKQGINSETTEFIFGKTDFPAAEIGKKYLFKIYAKNENLTSAEISDTTMVDSGWLKIASPVITKVQKYYYSPFSDPDLDSSSIRINWTCDNEVVDSVIVYREISLYEATFSLEDFVDGIKIENNIDSFVDTTVAEGIQWYYYKLQAYSKEFGLSDLSAVDSGHIRMKTPSNLEVLATDIVGQIEISWNEEKSVDSYYVTMFKDGVISGNDEGINGVYKLYDGLTYNTEYKFCVKAFNFSFGYSAFSDTVGPVSPKMPTPGNLFATKDWKDTIRLTWDTLIGYSSYDIQRYNYDELSYKTIRTNFTNDTFYDVYNSSTNKLISGKPYSYRVSIYNINYYSDVAEGYFAVHPPDSLKVVKSEDKNFIISWAYKSDTAYGVSSYVVYRKVMDGSFDENSFSSTDSLAIVINKSLSQTLISNTSYEKIERGLRYVYKIASLSDLSSKKLMSADTISSFIRMSAPENIVAEKKSDSVVLSWNTKKYAKKYMIRLDTNGVEKISYETSDTTFTLRKGIDIVEGVIYKAIISAYNTYTSLSLPDSISLSLPPKLPKIYSASKDSAGFIELRWKYISSNLVDNYLVTRTQLLIGDPSITYIKGNYEEMTDTLYKTNDTIVYRDYKSLVPGYKYSYNIGLISKINDTVYEEANLDTGWIKLTPPTYWDELDGDPSIGLLDTIKISWGAIEGNMVGYKAEISGLSNFSDILATKTIEKSTTEEKYSTMFNKTMDTIIPGKYYYFRVRSYIDFPSHSNYYVYDSYGCAKLNIPYDFEAKYENGKVNLYFCDSLSYKDSISYYIVYRNSDSIGTIPTLGDNYYKKDTLRYLDSTFMAGSGEDYIYGVKSVHKSLNKCNSAIDTCNIGKIGLEVPTWFKASKDVVDSLYFSWDKPDYISENIKDNYYYNIYISSTINGEFSEKFSTVDTFHNVANASAKDIDLGKNYYYKVKVNNKLGGVESDNASSIDSGVALLPSPNKNYYKITSYNDSISLFVNAFSEYAKKIYIYARKYKFGGDYSLIDSITLSSSYDTKKKTYDTNSINKFFEKACLYSFVTTSKNEIESPKTDSIFGGISKKLSLTADRYKDSIKISWEDMSSTNISKWVIYRNLLYETGENPYERTDTLYISSNTFSFTDKKENSNFVYNGIKKPLEIGRIYQYDAIAYSDNNYKLTYNSSLVSYLKIPAPKVSNITYSDRVYLYWDKITNIEKFKIYKKENGVYNYSAYVSDTFYTEYNAISIYDSCYYYKVRSFNSALSTSSYLDSSDLSDSCKVYLKPKHPLLLSKDDNLTNKIILYWKSQDSASYNNPNSNIRVYLLKDNESSVFVSDIAYTDTKQIILNTTKESKYKIFSIVIQSATDISVSDTSDWIYPYRVLSANTPLNLSTSITSVKDSIIKVKLELKNTNYKFEFMDYTFSPLSEEVIYKIFKEGTEIASFEGVCLSGINSYTIYDTCSGSDDIKAKHIYSLEGHIPYHNGFVDDTMKYYSSERDTFNFPAPAVSNLTATNNLTDSIKLTWSMPTTSEDPRVNYIDSLVISVRNITKKEINYTKEKSITSISQTGEEYFEIKDSSIYEYKIETYSSSGNVVDNPVNYASTYGFRRLFISKNKDGLTCVDTTIDNTLYKKIKFNLENFNYNWLETNDFCLFYAGKDEPYQGYLGNIIQPETGTKNYYILLINEVSEEYNYVISLRNFSVSEVNSLTNEKGNYLVDLVNLYLNSDENAEYFLTITP